MESKQQGKCPFCEESVEAVIQETNYLRRDRCSCPSCEQPIYLCRTPGCHDFAKGTSVYDHELCPACTDVASAVGAEVGTAALKIAATVGSALLLAAMKGDNGSGKSSKSGAR